MSTTTTDDSQWSDYTPGEDSALVSSATLALIDAAVPADVVTRVFQAVRDDGRLAAVVAPLVSSLADLPNFAVVVVDDGAARALVRGDLEVVVGEKTIDGRGVATWREETLVGEPDADTLEVVIQRLGHDGGDHLPVLAGVVRAARVVATLALRPAAAAPAAAVEAVEPAAEEVVDADPLPVAAPGADAEPDAVADADPAVAETEREPLAPPEDEAVSVAELGHRDEYVTEPAPAPETPLDVTLRPGPDSGATGHPVADDTDTVTDVDAGAVPADPASTPVWPDEAAAWPQEGDHDGGTILDSQVAHLRDNAPRDDAQGDDGLVTVSPWSQPEAEAEPRLRLTFSHGVVVQLDTPVLVGRAPEAAQGVDAQLVAVPSPKQDISRTHCEIRPDGEDVLVTDLHSTNGTVVSRPGQVPHRLHPGEGTSASVGSRIDLGDGVVILVES